METFKRNAPLILASFTAGVVIGEFLAQGNYIGAVVLGGVALAANALALR